ncbi:MAG: cytochrome c oxidase subunit 2A [Anaerolineales bacterium]|nr:cytochrome c oxidase subunit 2A [Anaerolineales bacterium]
MAKKNKGDDEFHPTGTIAILAIFVITLIAIWTTIYMILVGRGGTL